MSTGDTLALLRLMSKSPWSNNPADSGYGQHWNTARPINEPVEQVVPGVARQGSRLLGQRQPVNIVYTPDNVYIDTPQIERIGPVARGAGLLLDRGGFSDPLVLPRSTTTTEQLQPNRIALQSDALPYQVTGRPGTFVGQPSELSGREQLSNMWSMFRG